MSLAYNSEGDVYTWGRFPKGLALEPQSVEIETPKLHQQLTQYNFMDIQFTKDSAVAIGRSVQLSFNFLDNTVDNSIPETPGLLNEEINNKEYFEVKVHAIPVVDGSMVKSEFDVLQALTVYNDNNTSMGTKKESPAAKNNMKGLECSLINDFEVPWQTIRTAVRYPSYAKTIVTKKDRDAEASDDEPSMEEEENDKTSDEADEDAEDRDEEEESKKGDHSKGGSDEEDEDREKTDGDDEDSDDKKKKKGKKISQSMVEKKKKRKEMK